MLFRRLTINISNLDMLWKFFLGIIPKCNLGRLYKTINFENNTIALPINLVHITIES